MFQLNAISGSNVQLSVEGKEVSEFTWFEQQGRKLVKVRNMKTPAGFVPTYNDDTAGGITINMIERLNRL